MHRSQSSSHPYRLAAREGREDTVVRVGANRVPIGGDNVTVIAGPCAVEERDTILAIADALAGMGVPMLRGGAFKPRTSPYAFQGLGERGLELLAEARERTGLAVVTEVLAIEDIELVARHADMVQVGARNMANYRLLDALGGCGKPVLLKRGMGANVEELLCAAEYVLAAGNPDVVLCERGVRSFEPLVRNALDLNVVPLLRELTHLPVLVDPSHASGRASIVPALAAGSVAAGAHGVLVEMHVDPARALVDGAQCLDVDATAGMLTMIEAITTATGRRMTGAPHEVQA